MDRRFLLDVVVANRLRVIKLLAIKNEPLLFWWNPLLVLDLGLHLREQGHRRIESEALSLCRPTVREEELSCLILGQRETTVLGVRTSAIESDSSTSTVTVLPERVFTKSWLEPVVRDEWAKRGYGNRWRLLQQ